MIKMLPPRSNFISAAISASATILQIDSAFSAIIDASIDFGGGDYFYLTLYDAEDREEVKVTNKSGNNLAIVRAQGNTGVTPDTVGLAFGTSAKYTTEMNKAAVEDIAVGLAPVATVNITGTGLAQVTDEGGGNFTINVDALVLTGENGVEVTGTWPEYTIGLTNDGNCCAGESEGGSGDVTLIGAGIASVELTEDGWLIAVLPPVFTGVGVDITGTWPNYTFTVTAGGGGTVTSVAVGDGLSITGSPTVNPTITLDNTAVSPGTYGGVVITATGQIDGVPATFNPVSIITVATGTGLAISRTDDAVEVAGVPATDTAYGVVKLVDATGPLDDTDDTSTVTPAFLAAILADVAMPEVLGGATYSGEADGDYTDTLPTTAIALDLAGVDDKAIIFAHTTARGAVLTDPVNYAIAVFSATGTRIESNKKVNQNEHSMVFIMEGPFTDGLILKHTALAGGETIHSYSLVALKL